MLIQIVYTTVDPRLAAPVLPLGLRFGDAFALPLQHDFALELRHRGEHVQHELAGGAAGVDVAAWRGSRKTTTTAPSGPGAAKRWTLRSACNTSLPRQRRRPDARGA